MMKKTVLFAFWLAFVLASCRSRVPLSSTPMGVGETVPLTVDSSLLRSSEKVPRLVTSETILAHRLDSLVAASDTLLQTTQLGLHVVDLTTGVVLYAHGHRQRMRPASSEKVVTAIAALDQLGPGYMFTTQLLATGVVSKGVLQGDLYVRGVLDPLLSTSDVAALARGLKSAGVQRITGRLVADASFKDGDEYGWGWCWDDENPVLSPLLCGGKPGLAAELRRALQKVGVKVGVLVTGTTPPGARELVAVRRPLTAVLEPMLKMSDNLCAESVFYQMGKSRKQVSALIQPLVGDDGCTIADGSGLSLYNYQTPETFTRLLAYAAARPDSIFQPLLAALPIASVDGTLKNRMGGTAAEVAVRAKTGTVTGVSSLVGYTTQRSTNHLIAFAIMNQGVQKTAQGRAFQDKVCAVLSE